MRYLFVALWLWWHQFNTLNQISLNNQARQEAQAAYESGQYQRALQLYAALSRNTTTIDPAVRLNLGHTYFQLKRYGKARPQYETLLQSDRPDLRTVAATQLGVITCLEHDTTTALALFEQALLENPENEPARYNFELIKKHFSGKGPMPKAKPSPKPTQTSANAPTPVGRQVEQSDRQDEILRRFQRLNLSQEQALQLLDAMREDDLPYALTRSARRTVPRSAPGGNRW